MAQEKINTDRPLALITGASSGIGYELAKVFARDGYDLVIVARREAELQKLARKLSDEFGGKVKILVKDLGELNAAEEIYQTVKQEELHPQVLVNNAGLGLLGPFTQTDLSVETKIIHVNIRALTELTKFFVRDMVQRGDGKILNVASTAGFQPGPFMAVYYASKAYVLHFSEALANELKGTGVTVTALCPGPTITEFQERAGMAETRLFQMPHVMSGAEVARIGYEGMKQGKTVVIPGLINKLIAFSVRFSPRRLVAQIVRDINGKRS